MRNVVTVTNMSVSFRKKSHTNVWEPFKWELYVDFLQPFLGKKIHQKTPQSLWFQKIRCVMELPAKTTFKPTKSFCKTPTYIYRDAILSVFAEYSRYGSVEGKNSKNIYNEVHFSVRLYLISELGEWEIFERFVENCVETFVERM